MKRFFPLLISVFCLQFSIAQNSPVAGNDTFSINKNNSTNLPVLSNDFDIDGDPLTPTLLTLPLHGTATISGSQITYLPNLNYTGTDSFTYILCDTTGRCDTASVFITINNVNNAPVAGNDSFTINQNNPITVPVLSNDYDVDGDPLSISLLNLPANGTATVSGSQVNYQPNLNFTGTDSFTYIVCDTAGLCDTATVYIIITQGNNAPLAIDDRYTIPENLTAPLPVSSNDYDPDGDPLTITIIFPPVNGSATVNGNLVDYTPYPAYYGTDSFIYVICDTTGLCDTAAVYLTIGGSNLPPVAVDDNYTFTDTLTILSLNVLANDYDPENDLLTLTEALDINTSLNLGTLSIDSATRSLIFTRYGIACGSETFQYTICDHSACDTASLTITITCPQDIFLPEGFSPDGDGINDRLVFTRLEYFLPAALKVFNRYGNLVFEDPDYKNNWDGADFDTGKALPDGTYFYILQLADKRKYNNYLVINR